jgi:ABC-2 type transport system ATP-binding protein
MSLEPETLSPEPPLVIIENVSKSFGTKTALSDVTWSLPRGQISGLLGPNGAGKTTLFRLLMGILKASSGCMSIAGRDCFEDRVVVKRLVGFLPDEPVFYSYLSGTEVLELSAGMHGLEVKGALTRLVPLIQRLNMQDAMNQYADDYSRGMKKKLGLLLALLHQPPLLILDEPTNGLDVESTRLFFDLMREQAAAGTTIVFSTHLMDQVERLCSHAAVICSGKLVKTGALAEICGGRPLEEVFVELTTLGA